MLEELISEVELLVSQNQLEEALNCIERAFKKSSQNYHSDEVVLLKKQLVQLQSEHIQGILAYEDYKIQSNKIAKGILALVKNENSKPTDNVNSWEENSAQTIKQKGQNNILIQGDFNGNIKL